MISRSEILESTIDARSQERMGIGQAPRNPVPCPLCGAAPAEPFLILRGAPIFCCVLCPSEQESRAAATGDIELTNCMTCGMVFNRAFDPSLVEYAPGYDNALHFSPHFRNYSEALVSRLIRDYGLTGGVIAEIGAGDGYFLDLITRYGASLGIGYDPSATRQQYSPREGALVRMIPELFETKNLPPELHALICRHVLEHLASPLGFMKDLRTVLAARNPVLFFEVPNAALTLQRSRLAEIIYEHFTYWTPLTLQALFNRAGFAPLRTSTDFDDQFLSIDGKPSECSKIDQEAPDAAKVTRIAGWCRTFGEQCSSQMLMWQIMMSDLKEQGRTAVSWGAGARGVTFLNLAKADRTAIAGVVDINPRKRGKYVPGCGLPVIAPDELPSLRPDIVLLPNEIYRHEVSELLFGYGLNPEIRLIG